MLLEYLAIDLFKNGVGLTAVAIGTDDLQG